MLQIKKRLKSRKRRHQRIRSQLFGTAERPRMAVFRSASHIYVQAIDDEKGHTIVAASTVELGDTIKVYGGNKEAAKIVGQTIAKRLLEKSISKVVFDRGGFLYHGRISTLADAAREIGLEF